MRGLHQHVAPAAGVVVEERAVIGGAEEHGGPGVLHRRSRVALAVVVGGLGDDGLDPVLVLAVEAVKLRNLHHQLAADALEVLRVEVREALQEEVVRKAQQLHERGLARALLSHEDEHLVGLATRVERTGHQLPEHQLLHLVAVGGRLHAQKVVGERAGDGRGLPPRGAAVLADLDGRERAARRLRVGPAHLWQGVQEVAHRVVALRLEGAECEQRVLELRFRAHAVVALQDGLEVRGLALGQHVGRIERHVRYAALKHVEPAVEPVELDSAANLVK